MYTDCLVWVTFHGKEEKVEKVEEAINTIEEAKNVFTLGDIMSHLNMDPYPRDYGSFTIMGRSFGCGNEDDSHGIEIGFNYLRSPETKSPINGFDRIAEHFDLKYDYRVEDREGELFINTAISNALYDDRFVILGNCFGLESHALCEFFPKEALVIDWFRTNAKLTVSSIEDCIRLAKAITATKTGSSLSVITYLSEWK